MYVGNFFKVIWWNLKFYFLMFIIELKNLKISLYGDFYLCMFFFFCVYGCIV